VSWEEFRALYNNPWMHEYIKLFHKTPQVQEVTKELLKRNFLLLSEGEGVDFI
jgi:hypothetical protein